MSDTKFYVQLPADEYGNVGHPYYIIEATEEGDAFGAAFGSRLHVAAPAEFTSKWPTVRKGPTGVGDWVETEGPARKMTREEWVSIVEPLTVGWDVKYH